MTPQDQAQVAKLQTAVTQRDRVNVLDRGDYVDTYVCLGPGRCDLAGQIPGPCEFCTMYPREWGADRAEDFLRRHRGGH